MKTKDLYVYELETVEDTIVKSPSYTLDIIVDDDSVHEVITDSRNWQINLMNWSSPCEMNIDTAVISASKAVIASPAIFQFKFGSNTLIINNLADDCY